MENTYLIHADRYANWIFDPTHPTQGRRFINARNEFNAKMKASGGAVVEVEPRQASVEELARVHSLEYINEILVQNQCSEWSGPRPDLAELASYFVGGTLTALDTLLSGKTRTAIHFPGAKHHAQHYYASGFCIFADFAIAADIATKDHGKRVAILDFDGHHGDGTENLTSDNPDVLTYSVHEKGIFPGTGNESYPEKNVYNLPLVEKSKTSDLGKGDVALMKAASEFVQHVSDFKPDLIFIASGADGHLEDPLTSLEYSVEGIKEIGKFIRRTHPDLPILIGGAGGYLPDTRTPEVWSTFAHAVATTLAIGEDIDGS